MHRIIEVGSFSYPKPDKNINEDSLLLPTYDLQGNIIFGVADGVGSLNGANEASTCVLSTISKLVKEERDFSIDLAFNKAKKAIDELSINNELFSQAATTLTLVKISKEQVMIGHIGDCRAYVKKGNKFIQLTKDHTRYQQLLDRGEISKRKLLPHKQELSSILTQAINSRVEMKFETINLPIEQLTDEGTIVISLMSDGAHYHWHKRPRFSDTTMRNPLSFVNNLRRRIEKEPSDDFTCLTVKLTG